MLFAPIPRLDYIPAKLSQGIDWYVYFYVTDPVTQTMRRVRIKINRIKNKKERLKVARQMIVALNERLALGWNPFIEKSAPKSGTNIYDAMDAFITAKSKSAEANSMRSYKSFIKTFRSWMASKGADGSKFPVMSFTHQTALQLMKDVDEDDRISAQTYNNYLRFFTLLFNWFLEKGYVAENPFAGIKRKDRRKIKKKRRIMSDEELARLTGFLKENNPCYLAMCLMCYCCFMRPKEIALLRCEDIDLDNQTIHIRAEIAKNDNDSYRTIPDDMLPFLRGLDLSVAKNFVFSDSHTFVSGKKKVLTQAIARYWNDVIRPECGFPMELQFYSLKDTGITNMLGSGVPVSFVKQQADHGSLAMTSIYLGNLKGKANETLKVTSIIK
ncbi:MAG: tyrosine-type recombinase/integrase [Candidatus Cryptobacteroides sp.]